MRPEHKTLKVMGATLYGEDVKEGIDPFHDIVFANTIFGYFGATRSANGRWSWFLQTECRAPDDFDGIECEVYGGLETCIENANRQLGFMFNKIKEAIDENCKNG